MKAYIINRFGDHSIFEVSDLPKPRLKPGHVLIRVLATSVNPLDFKIREGVYAQIAPPFPAILHGDVAGVIEEVANDVIDFKVGDEVYGCAGGVTEEPGALAEFMLADARLIAKKPRSLNMAAAAALPLVCITAWEALFEKILISPGQNILIHAGTGGVGHIAIQLAAWASANVYATVSSSEKAAIAKSLGALDTINYREETPEMYVKRLTQGKGFDVVFDTVGGENIDHAISALAPYGNVITIQANSSHNLAPLHAKSGSLHSVLMLLPLLSKIQRERHGVILNQIAQLVDNRKLKPLIDARSFKFEDIGKAHALLQSGKAIGKVVVEAC